MDVNNAKLYIGQLTDEITEDALREHFNKYGEVTDCVKIIRYGFVTFSDDFIMKNALQDEHIILGTKVEVKPAITRNQNQNQNNKIFVGGLPHEISQEEFSAFFESFGLITDAVILSNKITGKQRGFGFITYLNEEALEKVLQTRYYHLKNKRVEVKKAKPRQQMNALYIQTQPNYCTPTYIGFGQNYGQTPFWTYSGGAAYYHPGFRSPICYYYNFGPNCNVFMHDQSGEPYIQRSDYGHDHSSGSDSSHC